MTPFLIETPHTKEDCVKAIKHVYAAGYLTHFYWGCKVGDHTGYAIIEASDKAEALMVVPTLWRPQSKVIQLTQFTPEEIKQMHEKG